MAITIKTYLESAHLPVGILETTLLMAAYWRTEESIPNRVIGLQRPDLAFLLRAWGRKGDTAVIAFEGDEAKGAAWFRFWTKSLHSYGFVDRTTPELAIGVTPSARRQGLGRRLLHELSKAAIAQGIQQLSLSVEIDNPARYLYVKDGFMVLETNGNAQTMIKPLKKRSVPKSLPLKN